MTLSGVIRMADEIKPNAFSEEVKTSWVNEAEGMVQTEVMLIAIEDITAYSWTEDQGTELLVRPPHDKLYWTYLTAMIDFANGEYNKYQNTMQLFNAYFGEYMRWFAERYRPADGEDVQGWPGYYISAYGIAVKHGFSGTEEEWLESLKGTGGGGGGTGADGVGIDSLYQSVKSYEDDGINIWRARLTDGREYAFEVQNGSRGSTGAAGAPGAAGAAGEDGQDGFSPIVSVSKVGKITTITIQDVNGIKTATIKDGEDGSGGGGGGTGADGEDGIGIASIVQTTKSTEDDGINVMTITLTDGSVHTFEVQNGSKGSKGNDGYTPVKGKDYFDGAKGDPGYTPQKGVDYFDGKNGTNGTSCTHYWNGTTLVVSSASGTSSANLKGEKGDPGSPGTNGQDYVLTSADKTEIAQQAAALIDNTLLSIIGEVS